MVFFDDSYGFLDVFCGLLVWCVVPYVVSSGHDGYCVCSIDVVQGFCYVFQFCCCVLGSAFHLSVSFLEVWLHSVSVGVHECDKFGVVGSFLLELSLRFSICFLFSFASSFHLRHSVSVSSSFLCVSSLSWSISICRLSISVRWLMVMSLIFFYRFLMVLQWFLLASISFSVLFLSFWMLFSSLLSFFCRSFEFCDFGYGSVVSDLFLFLSSSSANRKFLL